MRSTRSRISINGAVATDNFSSNLIGDSLSFTTIETLAAGAEFLFNLLLMRLRSLRQEILTSALLYLESLKFHDILFMTNKKSEKLALFIMYNNSLLF